jgi:radical SAM enzyme (TIGR01210 family)
MADELTHLVLQVRQIMKTIRGATPKKGAASWNKPADLVLRDDFLDGKRVSAASMTLFPTGCQYAAVGGCTMCGEWSGSNLGTLVSPEFHIAQFAAASADLVSRKDINWLRIYQEGSFLNEDEIAPEAREIILRLASHLRGIQRITIESRPEYLTADLTRLVREYTSSIELEIGIGLEAKDDFVRNVCIGKGTTLISYEKAVRVAHASNIIALAYVLIKPPFLSEQEAIDEAVETTKFAFETGFDEVYVQAASIHEWSLSEMLASRGFYSPPWLWSVMEVVKQTAKLGKVKIGGLEYFPRPAKVAQNYSNTKDHTICQCSHDIWQVIQEFNATGNVALLSAVACSCQETWRALLRAAEDELPSRVVRLISSVSVDDYIRSKLSQV